MRRALLKSGLRSAAIVPIGKQLFRPHSMALEGEQRPNALVLALDLLSGRRAQLKRQPSLALAEAQGSLQLAERSSP